MPGRRRCPGRTARAPRRARTCSGGRRTRTRPRPRRARRSIASISARAGDAQRALDALARARAFEARRRALNTRTSSSANAAASCASVRSSPPDERVGAVARARVPRSHARPRRIVVAVRTPGMRCSSRPATLAVVDDQRELARDLLGRRKVVLDQSPRPTRLRARRCPGRSGRRPRIERDREAACAGAAGELGRASRRRQRVGTRPRPIAPSRAAPSAAVHSTTISRTGPSPRQLHDEAARRT